MADNETPENPVPAEVPAAEPAAEAPAAEAAAAPSEPEAAPAAAAPAEAPAADATAVPAVPEAVAPVSVVPVDAAQRAAEIAARLAGGQPVQPAFPVSSGAEHAAEDSNKRKIDGVDGTEDPNDPNKRAYTDPAMAANPYAQADPGVLHPIGAPEGTVPQYAGMPQDAQEIIPCPHNIVGKIIGKGGETIRDLQNRSGARIQVDHNVEEGKPRTITILGNAACVATAKKMVDDIIAQGESGAPSGAPGEGELKETIQCPPGIVGRVIGRGGETIRALQAASGAHISIDQNFPEGQDRQVHVQGKPENVERGVKMVTELIAGGPGSANDAIQKHGGGITQSLACPKTMVGRVIGKGGETIKALQNTSGARIQIDQSTDPMTVTITGNQDCVARAEAAVTDIINGGSGFLQTGHAGGYGGGYGYQAPGGYGSYGGYPGYGAAAYGGYPGYGAAAYGGYGQQQGAYAGYGQQGYDYSQQQAYAQPAQAQQPAAAAPAAPAAAGAVWQELQDPQGRPYYYNSQTDVSQWEKPAEMQ